MKARITQFLRDEEGATAIEYGIIAGLMAILLVAIFDKDGTLGTALTKMFDTIADVLPTTFESTGD